MRHLATFLAAFGLITAGAAFAGDNCTSVSGATCAAGSEQIAAAPADGSACTYSPTTAAAAQCPAGGTAAKEIASADAANCDTAECPASECTGNETIAATTDEAVEAAPGGADVAPAAE